MTREILEQIAHNEMLIEKYTDQVTRDAFSQLTEDIKRHKADTLKAMRDLALTESDFFIQRHTEEKMLGLKPTLSSDEVDKLLAYRQKLRDLTDSASFPECELPELPVEIL